MSGTSDESLDARFTGEIPEIYERLLVPMIFHAAALRLAGAVGARTPHDVLETAAGTGVLTRELVPSCPGASITATDLNQPMLDTAARTIDDERVRWQQADALDLPFDDDSFDVVVCQFGAMFFPDRVQGYREARRVLKPGGAFLFNVWDKVENNEVPQIITAALIEAAPENPLSFLSRTPYGYHDPALIRADLERAGLADVTVTPVDGISRSTVSEAVIAYCQGTPLRGEIEAHPTFNVATATAIAEAALLRHFGPGPIEARIRSFEVVASPASA
ncbi:MAG: SAM-dependent methyltransferase [Marmoricola sp.]|nr:SAM-dependent methyltransferase [Marmoricola sp.]